MQVRVLAEVVSIMVSPLLDIQGQSLQGRSSRLSPPAEKKKTHELGNSAEAKEAMLYLSPVLSIHSKAKTAGGIFIAYSSISLFG